MSILFFVYISDISGVLFSSNSITEVLLTPGSLCVESVCIAFQEHKPLTTQELDSVQIS
jgi:hypothetical protein